MIAKFFIERPVLANVIAWLMLLLGAVALLGLPVAQYPPLTPPTGPTGKKRRNTYGFDEFVEVDEAAAAVASARATAARLVRTSAARSARATAARLGPGSAAPSARAKAAPSAQVKAAASAGTSRPSSRCCR